ncbi:hypothetical protein M569_15599, partial [Genlisea aurea]
SGGRKRTRDDSSLQDSLIYKMRSTVGDLRPHFIEVVLKTPDFRNCKAADSIREGMKLLIDLYKQAAAADHQPAAVLEKCSSSTGGDDDDVLSNGQKHQHQQEAAMKPDGGEDDVVSAAGGNQGSCCCVGGSAFGWNFITFVGSSEAVYYGRKKEEFRAANPKSEEES